VTLAHVYKDAIHPPPPSHSAVKNLQVDDTVPCCLVMTGDWHIVHAALRSPKNEVASALRPHGKTPGGMGHHNGWPSWDDPMGA